MHSGRELDLQEYDVGCQSIPENKNHTFRIPFFREK